MLFRSRKDLVLGVLAPEQTTWWICPFPASLRTRSGKRHQSHKRGLKADLEAHSCCLLEAEGTEREISYLSSTQRGSPCKSSTRRALQARLAAICKAWTIFPPLLSPFLSLWSSAKAVGGFFPNKKKNRISLIPVLNFEWYIMDHFSYFSFSAPWTQCLHSLDDNRPGFWPKAAVSRAALPVPSAVPANHQMPGLILTLVKVQIVLGHQVHIMEYEAVPNFILESF